LKENLSFFNKKEESNKTNVIAKEENSTSKLNIKEKLSPEFDDLIKTLQFPDKFYDILDRVIKREVEENRTNQNDGGQQIL